MQGIPRFPIHEVVEAVRSKLSETNIVILQAPPGAGKSTILPLELLSETFLSGRKMIMLEPRRLAARSVAQRMASLLGEDVGETVGFRIRFETKVSSRTKIEIVTEGILTRMLQNDNALENYALVLFDEFHERSLNADLSLALCLQSKEILRPNLKLLIMSATLDGDQLSGQLNNAPIVTSQGKEFPVKIIYAKENSSDPLPVQMVQAIKNALNAQKGDILAFLPGAGEILRTQEILVDANVNAKVVPLYGDLTFSRQQEAILPDKSGMRKIILSTSIAETSLTIEGVTSVIDSGYSRSSVFDTRSGLSKLSTFRVTKDAAEQRAGRAGRLGPGVCYRLWTEATHLQLQPQRKPEILEADLAPLMLELYKWGATNVNELKWITVPPAANVAHANDLLESINAIKDRRITSEGKELLKFPTHPRLAHMFLQAQQWDKKENNKIHRLLAADIAALIEERDPLERTMGVDLYDRLELLAAYRKKDFVSADKRLLERIERLSQTWRKLLGVDLSDKLNDDYVAGKLVAAIYPERIAKQVERNKPLYKLANGRSARLPEGDSLVSQEWLAIALVDAGQKEGKIFLAAAMDVNDVAHLAEKKLRMQWDEREGKLISQEELSIGQIQLSVKSVRNTDEKSRISILMSAIKKEGLKSFGWDEYCENWQARVMSLRKWNEEEEWPDVSDEKLLDTIETWLAPFLINVNTREDAKKLNWKEIADSVLSFQQQQQLAVLAPEKIVVPTGSSIKLLYFIEGKNPELHVRLQEVFGMKDTPAINKGKTKVVMHLLSPGYKPVQVTQDLNSFWSSAYHDVRKELQRRYPRHAWPENPFEATPVRGPQKRR